MSAIAENPAGFAPRAPRARSSSSRNSAESLSAAQARRIALAAQGFTDPRPTGAVTRRQLRRVLGRTGVLQIDSVNVLQRAHYLPMFSRLGAYPAELLDRRRAAGPPGRCSSTGGTRRRCVPVALHPYLRWRMAEAHKHAWGRMRGHRQRFAGDRGVGAARGARARAAHRRPRSSWTYPPERKLHWGWNWSDAKSALEWLFWTGEISTAGRNSGFRPALRPHRAGPPGRGAADTDAQRAGRRSASWSGYSARSLGVAAEIELRDYFRLTGRRVPPGAGRTRGGGDAAPGGGAGLEAAGLPATPRRRFLAGCRRRP